METLGSSKKVSGLFKKVVVALDNRDLLNNSIFHNNVMSWRKHISSDDHYASLVCAIAAVVPSNCDGDCMMKIDEFLLKLL